MNAELEHRVKKDQRYTELTAAAEKVRKKIQEVAQLPTDKILQHMPELLEMLARVECGRQGIIDETKIQIQRETAARERESDGSGIESNGDDDTGV